jgi:cyclopropane fatty-acyl-phospholipid synthase-like methyltransferase
MTFNEWRDKYSKMSYDEQVKYHNLIEEQYPDQAHYTYDNVKQVLSDGIKVLEFGCWKADLAARAILEYNIKEWKGVEICTTAIEKTKCTANNFKYIVPKKFDWFNTKVKPKCDVIIATHFIEHLSNEHFEQLAEYCAGVPLIYFESPLSNEGESWDGYIGTHKLNYGWDKVNEIMKSKGYFIKSNFAEGNIYSL